MAIGRTLHVRCNTWDQVEVFRTRKLRHGRLLSMKVPFQTKVGAQLTLGLELPNQLVMAIDGVVQKASAIEGDAKTWIELELSGFTEDMVARIKAMASAAITRDESPPPAPALALLVSTELPRDERQVFHQLTAELRRLRVVAVHEVLDVDRDADVDEIRAGWLDLVRRHHPDLVARYNAPAITHLAEELTILCNRAYDRLRAAIVAEGRGTAIGSALRQPAGWLVGFDDISSTGAPRPDRATQPPASDAPASASSAQGSETFEDRARGMLGDGNARSAQEVLAAALCVYPRSRPLRSLYYVASAIAALQSGELMLATSQLETALAHHERCGEAEAVLEHIRIHGSERGDLVRRLFR